MALLRTDSTVGTTILHGIAIGRETSLRADSRSVVAAGNARSANGGEGAVSHRPGDRRRSRPSRRMISTASGMNVWPPPRSWQERARRHR